MNPILTIALLISSILLSNVKSEYEQPQLLDKGGVVFVNEGDSIQLPCNVKNLGDNVRLWKFNKTQVLFAGNLRIQRDERYRRNDATGALTVSHFSEDNSGIYTCEVSTDPPLTLDYKVKLVKSPRQ